VPYDKKHLELVAELERGRYRVRIYARESQGDGERFWTLSRNDGDGFRHLASGRFTSVDDIRRAIKELGPGEPRAMTQAPGATGEARPLRGGRPRPRKPEAEEESTKLWWPVVKVKEVRPDGRGVIVEVARSHEGASDAQLDAHKNRALVAWHAGIPREPAKDEKLIAEYGENAKLDLVMDRHRWREETQGVRTTLGLWASSEGPRVGQPVSISLVSDYQERPKDHYVLPRGQRHPAVSETPLYAVVRLSEKSPLRGTLAGVREDRQEAVALRQVTERGEQLARELSDNGIGALIGLKMPRRGRM